MVVPVGLQGLLGRTEITRSMRTGDRREANRRLALWETHVGVLLATLRRGYVTMTREQLDELTDRYLRATFDEIESRLALDEWTPAGRKAHVFDLVDEGHRLAGALAHSDFGTAMDAAKALAPQASPETLRKLARRFLEVRHEAIEAEIAAFNGEPLRMPSARAQPQQPPAPTPEATPRLSEVVARYAEERIARKSWSPRSSAQYREIFAVIADLLGDPPVGAVTKDAIRSLGLALTNFPSNHKKVFPGLSPSEALTRAADNFAVARLSSASVNMYQQAVRSLFKWAAEHDLVLLSPATVLRDLKTGRAKDERKPFNDEDLRAYFAALDASKVEPFMYWIPRILAYSGCRLGEVAQLRKKDIREQQGLWFFDINEDAPGTRLKTDSSTRQVPVHPRLIELGLLEFVSHAPDDFLWPADMRSTPRADRSPIDKLQKRLANQMRNAGIDDKKKTAAHSFRHTVAARLSQAGAHESDIAWILGHEQVTITSKRYGDQPAVSKLYAVLQLLDLPI